MVKAATPGRKRKRGEDQVPEEDLSTPPRLPVTQSKLAECWRSDGTPLRELPELRKRGPKELQKKKNRQLGVWRRQLISNIRKGPVAPVSEIKDLAEKGVDLNKTGWFEWELLTPLGHAMSAYNHGAFKTLLQLGAKPSAEDLTNIVKFMCDKLTSEDNVAELKLLVSAGVDMNALRLRDGRTLLMRAVQEHKKIPPKKEKTGLNWEWRMQKNVQAMIDFIVSCPAFDKCATWECDSMDTHSRDRGVTASLIATKAGNTIALSCLAKAGGAQFDVASRSGNSPVLHAVTTRNHTILGVLLNNMANPNGPSSEKVSITPLVRAVRLKDRVAVDKLLEAGADINKISGDVTGDVTPCGCAVRNGHVDLLEHLLSKGGDPGGDPLVDAVRAGEKGVVELLLKKGADVNKRTPDGVSALPIAVLNRHTDITKLLVEAGADVGRTDPVPLEDGASACLAAARIGNLKELRYIISKGGNVNAADQRGRSPVWVAARNGHVQTLRELLDRGGDCRKADDKGQTPFLVAAARGRMKILRILLDHGADAGQADNDGETPCLSAVKKGRVKVVSLLRELNVNMSVPGQDGTTPMLAAARKWGEKDTSSYLSDRDHDALYNYYDERADTDYSDDDDGDMKMLAELDRGGAEMNAADNNGDTGLYALAASCQRRSRKNRRRRRGYMYDSSDDDDKYDNKAQRRAVRWFMRKMGKRGQDTSGAVILAAKRGKDKILERLLDGGVEPNGKGPDGGTALHDAVVHCSSSTVRMMLNEGAEHQIVREDGNTPLLLACRHGKSEVTRMLLPDSDRNYRRAGDGATPCFLAAKYGHHQTLLALLGTTADPNLPANCGTTPCLAAAREDHGEAIRVLISFGADPEKAGPNGETPLHVAAQFGCTFAVEALLDKGAAPNVVMPSGATPAFIAAQSGHDEILRQLIAGGGNAQLAREDGVTPLEIALQLGRERVVRELLAQDASVNVLVRFLLGRE
eukprot:Hpha_TRINITY_DN15882_c1_g8::TRINITY_DN15882_c1_g8_i1::g.189260::m.189260/K10380/ANK; ankyrin